MIRIAQIIIYINGISCDVTFIKVLLLFENYFTAFIPICRLVAVALTASVVDDFLSVVVTVLCFALTLTTVWRLVCTRLKEEGGEMGVFSHLALVFCTEAAFGKTSKSRRIYVGLVNHADVFQTMLFRRRQSLQNWPLIKINSGLFRWWYPFTNVFLIHWYKKMIYLWIELIYKYNLEICRVRNYG